MQISSRAGKKRGRGGKGRARTAEAEVEPAPKKAKKEKAAAAAAARGAPGGKAPFVDALGELGPNGQKRMKGGNPAASLCKNIRDNGKCPFEFCSFKHA